MPRPRVDDVQPPRQLLPLASRGVESDPNHLDSGPLRADAAQHGPFAKFFHQAGRDVDQQTVRQGAFYRRRATGQRRYTRAAMSIDAGISTAAQAIFDHAGGRALRAYRLIASLLEFMRHGAPSAKEGLVVEAAREVRALVARFDFGTEEQRKTALASMPETANGAAKRTIADAMLTAEAAGVVFMHSMLDAAADDYLRICVTLDPSDWYSEVQTEKVTLAQARGDWDTLFRAAVDREVKRLKNESLPRKIEVLQAVCKPGNAEMLKDYTYDAARLKSIDQFRHAAIHQRIDPPGFDVIAAVGFMERTQVYLSVLVTHRHGLKLGPEALNAVF